MSQQVQARVEESGSVAAPLRSLARCSSKKNTPLQPLGPLLHKTGRAHCNHDARTRQRTAVVFALLAVAKHDLGVGQRLSGGLLWSQMCARDSRRGAIGDRRCAGQQTIVEAPRPTGSLADTPSCIAVADNYALARCYATRFPAQARLL